MPRMDVYETDDFLLLQTLLPKFMASLSSVLIHHVYRVFVIVWLNLSGEFTTLTNNTGSNYLTIPHLKELEQSSYLPVLAGC